MYVEANETLSLDEGYWFFCVYCCVLPSNTLIIVKLLNYVILVARFSLLTVHLNTGIDT